MPSDLPLDCRKILSRWSAQGYYVYMRPVSSKHIDPTRKHTVYWTVSVEYRTVPPGYWRAEDYSLADVIRELDRKVPRLKGDYHKINQKDQPGWMAPKAMQDTAKRRAKKKRRKQRQ